MELFGAFRHPTGGRAKPALLFAYDYPEVLRAVERDLRREYGQEYSIVWAKSSNSALDALTQLKLRRKKAALLPGDQRMPGMQGTEFLASASKVYLKAKRMLLTVYADTSASIDAIDCALTDYYLLKPWSPAGTRVYIRCGTICWTIGRTGIDRVSWEYAFRAAAGLSWRTNYRISRVEMDSRSNGSMRRAQSGISGSDPADRALRQATDLNVEVLATQEVRCLQIDGLSLQRHVVKRRYDYGPRGAYYDAAFLANAGHGADVVRASWNQVWTKLVSNAVEAMNGTGVLKVSTRLDEKWGLVTNGDNGLGIAKSALGWAIAGFTCDCVRFAGTRGVAILRKATKPPIMQSVRPGA